MLRDCKLVQSIITILITFHPIYPEVGCKSMSPKGEGVGRRGGSVVLWWHNNGKRAQAVAFCSPSWGEVYMSPHSVLVSLLDTHSVLYTTLAWFQVKYLYKY